MIPSKQTTLAGEFVLSGIGLHEGQESSLCFKPAEADHGFVFKRMDLPGQPLIPLKPEFLGDAKRRTQLERGGAVVHTTEHVIAGLFGAGVDNALIEISGEEPPAMDGSCRMVVGEVMRVGRRKLAADAPVLRVAKTMRIGHEDAWIEIAPGSGSFEVVYHLDYKNDAIPVSTVVYSWSTENFLEQISSARTFCLESEAKALQAAGFGKGATSSNTLVVDDDGEVLDTSLRFPDEFARHKILDLVGDFALLGARLDAKVTSWRGGHSLNHQAVRHLLNE